MHETQVWSLGREDPVVKEMATHFSIRARKIPWTEDPGGLQSMGSQRFRRNWGLTLSTHTFYRDNWTPVQTHTPPPGVSQPHSLQCRDLRGKEGLLYRNLKMQSSRVCQISGLPLWLQGGELSKYTLGFTGLITEVMLALNLLFFLFMSLKTSIVVGKVMSLLFNMLFRLVIAFLPGSKQASFNFCTFP